MVGCWQRVARDISHAARATSPALVRFYGLNIVTDMPVAMPSLSWLTAG